MSFTIEKWFEDDMEYAKGLEKSIPRLYNANVMIWDFEHDEKKPDTKHISITLWPTTKNADVQKRRQFMDVQKRTLEQIGSRERAESVDLASLKYRFEQDCWEYRAERCSIDHAILSLEKTYNNEFLSSWKYNGCIPCCALYHEMQVYDYTDPNGRATNIGHSSMAHIAEGVCARMYNMLAEKETENLAEQALTYTGYSGFRLKTSPEIENIADADPEFQIQLDRCKKSMMKMLDQTPEGSFKEQYMECMKAMFCFGTLYKTWIHRHVRF